MQTDYQQTFIEWRAKIVLEVGNQIIFVVVVSVIYLIGPSANKDSNCWGQDI